MQKEPSRTRLEGYFFTPFGHQFDHPCVHVLYAFTLTFRPPRILNLAPALHQSPEVNYIEVLAQVDLPCRAHL